MTPEQRVEWRKDALRAFPMHTDVPGWANRRIVALLDALDAAELETARFQVAHFDAEGRAETAAAERDNLRACHVEDHKRINAVERERTVWFNENSAAQVALGRVRELADEWAAAGGLHRFHADLIRAAIEGERE